MRRAWLTLAIAAAAILAGAGGLSATEHLSYAHGLFCSVGTASTVGCDVTARGGSAQAVSVAVMLTAIPALAATFALVTGYHWRKHLDRRLREHHQAIRKALNSGSEEGQ